MTKPLISDLLDNIPFDEIILPDEPTTCSHLANILSSDSNDHLTPASQSSIQHALDEISYDCLFMELDIHNQAHLTAISAGNETSCWLKAPPIPSIGLQMPATEFRIALKVWLGIPFTPLSTPIICPCSNVIDHYTVTTCLAAAMGHIGFDIMMPCEISSIMLLSRITQVSCWNKERAVTPTLGPVISSTRTLIMASRDSLMSQYATHCNPARFPSLQPQLA